MHTIGLDINANTTTKTFSFSVMDKYKSEAKDNNRMFCIDLHQMLIEILNTVLNDKIPLFLNEKLEISNSQNKQKSISKGIFFGRKRHNEDDKFRAALDYLILKDMEAAKQKLEEIKMKIQYSKLWEVKYALLSFQCMRSTTSTKLRLTSKT